MTASAVRSDAVLSGRRTGSDASAAATILLAGAGRAGYSAIVADLAAAATLVAQTILFPGPEWALAALAASGFLLAAALAAVGA